MSILLGRLTKQEIVRDVEAHHSHFIGRPVGYRVGETMVHLEVSVETADAMQLADAARMYSKVSLEMASDGTPVRDQSAWNMRVQLERTDAENSRLRSRVRELEAQLENARMEQRRLRDMDGPGIAYPPRPLYATTTDLERSGVMQSITPVAFRDAIAQPMIQARGLEGAIRDRLAQANTEAREQQDRRLRELAAAGPVVRAEAAAEAIRAGVPHDSTKESAPEKPATEEKTRFQLLEVD